jgi:hypothetical protein
MKKKPTKSRNRREGKTAQLAETDLLSALQLSVYGKEFSELERMVLFYIENLERVRILESGKKPVTQGLSWLHGRSFQWPLNVEEELIVYRGPIKHQQNFITGILLDAIKSKEAGKIIKIAEAVERADRIMAESAFDPMRHYVLMAKLSVGKEGKGKTIEELAKGYYSPKDFHLNKVNSFFDLRRLCNTLKYPYKRVRK